jgi:hypothetical protein
MKVETVGHDKSKESPPKLDHGRCRFSTLLHPAYVLFFRSLPSFESRFASPEKTGSNNV